MMVVSVTKPLQIQQFFIENVCQFHIYLIVILHNLELYMKNLFQFFKHATWMILNKIFTSFKDNSKDIIFESETKQVDDVSFHNFTINFNSLLEDSNVNIRINVFNINWVLQLFVKQLVHLLWYRLCNNWWIPWWHKHVWIKHQPSK